MDSPNIVSDKLNVDPPFTVVIAMVFCINSMDMDSNGYYLSSKDYRRRND